MKEYFRFFRWLYIILGVLIVVCVIEKLSSRTVHYERTNTECTTTQRVFDYADVLTDSEEKELAALIDKREKETNCDIILITLEQSLKEYARAIEPSVGYDEFVRVYAEQFYEENKFGYNKPNGDGVLLIDNWFREDDGKIYTWFCTTGIVEDRYTASAIDRILDKVYLYVEDDPYKAYTTYVNEFYYDMTGNRDNHDDWDWYRYAGLSILVGFIAMVIFIAINWKSKSGRKTTNAVTYVNGKRADFVNRQDIFIRKTVTKRHIQSSSSSGGGHSGSHGGGGHSRGGGGHGGGGHSR